MENTQKSHQTPGPFPSPRQGLQNTGKTSEVINPAHNQQKRFFRIIKVENTVLTKPDNEL